MTSDEAQPEITDKTTVTLWDQFKAFYWGAPWLWWVLGACFIFVFLSSSGGDKDDDTFFSAPVVIGLFVLLWVAVIVFSYWRLSREQKQVRYRVTTERIEFNDGTGAAVAIPWTGIKRCVETRSPLLFRRGPRAYAGCRSAPSAMSRACVALPRNALAPRRN